MRSEKFGDFVPHSMDDDHCCIFRCCVSSLILDDDNYDLHVDLPDGVGVQERAHSHHHHQHHPCLHKGRTTSLDYLAENDDVSFGKMIV